jgi:hypothetical protein
MDFAAAFFIGPLARGLTFGRLFFAHRTSPGRNDEFHSPRRKRLIPKGFALTPRSQASPLAQALP